MKILDDVYKATANEMPMTATDILVDWMDEHFRNGTFSEVSNMLDIADVKKMATQTLTGLLTISYHAKDKLGDSRNKIFQRALDDFRDRRGFSEERITRLIQRLS
jgi:uncharacterized pyridoxal phosphate-containing UPF0001 family protein